MTDVLVHPITADDLPFAEEAARWMTAFYRGLAARLDGAKVLLSGNMEAGRLLEIWRVCLANERAVAEASTYRQLVLDELAR